MPETVTETYTEPGEHVIDTEFVNSIYVESVGGDGADGADGNNETSGGEEQDGAPGGLGGHESATIDTSSEEEVTVVVGEDATTEEPGTGLTDGHAGGTGGESGFFGCDGGEGGRGGASGGSSGIAGYPATEAFGGAGGGGGAVEMTTSGLAAGGGGGGEFFSGGRGGSVRHAGTDLDCNEGGDDGDGPDGGAGGETETDAFSTEFTESPGSGGGGEGGGSEVFVEYDIVVPPGDIENLSVESEFLNEVTIAWDETDPVDTFEIERDGTVVDEIPDTETSYTDTGLTASTEYAYRVRAINDGDAGEWSSQLLVNTGGPPETVVVSASGNNINVIVSEPVGDYESLILDRREPSYDTERVEVDSVTDGEDYEFVDESLPEGREHEYLARSSYADGESEDTVDSATTELPAPTGLEAEDVRESEADISWVDASSDEDGYRVEQREDDEGEWQDSSGELPPGSNSAKISGLLNGQLYGVRVVVFTEDAEEVDE